MNFPILVCEQFARHLEIDYNPSTLAAHFAEGAQPMARTAAELLPHINEVGMCVNLTFVHHQLPQARLPDLLHNAVLPVLVLPASPEQDPFMLVEVQPRQVRLTRFHAKKGVADEEISPDAAWQLLSQSLDGQALHFVAAYQVEPMLSIPGAEKEKLTPLRRFWRLLMSEKRDILLVLVYATAVGLLSLATPLGVQSIVGMISGGLLLQPVIILIVVVVLATMFSGFLQIQQLRVVETLQRRVFTRAAFEFAFRIPRVRLEAINHYYAPELMNRFFDILTIQKGFAKLLTEFSTSILSVVFGLLLLSFYHPFFVFFDILLVTVLVLIFRLSGPKGLRSSLAESEYKYKVAHWLQDIARTMVSFKMAGNSNLPMNRMDEHVSHYLKQRRIHFGVLVGQYSAMLVFKVLITGGVLVLGSILVIDREITLGQFVAAEIVIILVMTGVEKIVMSLEDVYDLLTASAKVGKVTDLPLDTNRGVMLTNAVPVGVGVEINHLSYTYPDEDEPSLEDVSFSVKPGQRVAIVGPAGAGKSTFLRIATGLLFNYKGAIEYDGILVRDINPNSLRGQIGECLVADSLFEGTILENITLGKVHLSMDDVQAAVRLAGLQPYLRTAPDGLHTMVWADGKQLSSSARRRIILARAIAERPRLFLLEEGYIPNDENARAHLLPFLLDGNRAHTVIAVTTNPEFLARADNVVVMQHGRVTHVGPWAVLCNIPEVAGFAAKNPSETDGGAA